MIYSLRKTREKDFGSPAEVIGYLSTLSHPNNPVGWFNASLPKITLVYIACRR